MSILKGKLLSEKSFYKISKVHENIKEDAHEYAIRKFTRTWRSIAGE